MTPYAVLHLLADTASAVDPSALVQYGALGVICAVLIVFARVLLVFARGVHQREQERADRLEREVQRLHEIMLDRVIPALTSATRAAEASGELLASVQREREQSRLFEQRRPKGSN